VFVIGVFEFSEHGVEGSRGIDWCYGVVELEKDPVGEPVFEEES